MAHKVQALGVLWVMKTTYFFLQLIAVCCNWWPWNCNSLHIAGENRLHFTRAQECTFLPFPPLGQTGLAKLPRKKRLFQMVLSCTTGRDEPFPKTPVQQRESPSFPSALLLLACKARKWWHSSGGTYLSTSGHKIHIYWGDWLHLQDGLLLKTEEIRFQAALGNRNGQISFLNTLSDLEYSSQAGKKKYSFCNLALL